MLTFWIRVLWSNAILLKREVIGFNLLQENATNSKLAIAQITWVEVLSAMSRRQREGSLSEPILTQYAATFAKTSILSTEL